ncbi:MAG: Rieske (2Fe-2S) protein [Anaerolineae bacterium]|nr:Rieske (2Fe-2S) protein [Anaerolineae bacterium]
MQWVSVLREENLPEGERRVVEVGDHSILVLRHDGRVYAVASACPHMRLPLKRAKVEHGTIECPWHHSAFSLETGDVEAWTPWPPAVGRMLGALSREKALPVFPAKIEEGQIWVGVPDGH